jgi:hypothetical protein
MIEDVAEDGRLGQLLLGELAGELGVERRLQQGLAVEPRDLGGIDRVEGVSVYPSSLRTSRPNCRAALRRAEKVLVLIFL